MFAMIVVFVMIRKPIESSKLNKQTSNRSSSEFQKVQTESQSANANGNRRASESDWEKVREIAKEFSPKLADLEKARADIIATGAQLPPSVRTASSGPDETPMEWRKRWKAENQPYMEAWESYHRKLGLTEKAIRDLEREQWAEMSQHLSAFELRKYRMENSFAGRNLREESAWFEPSEGEFLWIFLRKEHFNDFADQHFEGSKGEMNQMVIDGGDRIQAILSAINDKTPDERMAEIEANPELQLFNEYLAINKKVSKSVPQMSVARRTLWQNGENASDESVKAEIELVQVQEMKQRGQATIADVNAAKERTIAIDEAEMESEFDE